MDIEKFDFEYYGIEKFEQQITILYFHVFDSYYSLGYHLNGLNLSMKNQDEQLTHCQNSYVWSIQVNKIDLQNTGQVLFNLHYINNNSQTHTNTVSFTLTFEIIQDIKDYNILSVFIKDRSLYHYFSLSRISTSIFYGIDIPIPLSDFIEDFISFAKGVETMDRLILVNDLNGNPI
jgi:hypothetical protein